MLKLVGASLTLLIVTVLVSILRPGDKLSLLLTVLIAAGFVSANQFRSTSISSRKCRPSTSFYRRTAAFLLMALAKVILILIGAPLAGFRMGSILRTSSRGGFSF